MGMDIGGARAYKKATSQVRRLRWLEGELAMAVEVVEAQPDVMRPVGVMDIVLTGAFACHGSVEVEETLFCYNGDVCLCLSVT